MSRYSFPILTKREILSSLAGLGMVDLAEGDLMKPTADTVKPVYEHMMEFITGNTREELHQPDFRVLEMMEFPDLHELSIGNLAFSRSLTNTMQFAGVSDFSRKDIYKPEANRVIKHFSAIINFSKYRSEKLKAFQSEQDRLTAYFDRQQQLEEANAKVYEEMRVLEEQEILELPEVENLKKEILKLEEIRKPMKDKFSKIQIEEKKLREESESLMEKINEAKSKLEISKQNVENFKLKIAESPEKIQKTLEEQHATLEAQKSIIEAEEKKLKFFQNRLECVSKAERKVQKYKATMTELEEKALKQKGLSKALKETRGEIATNEREGGKAREAKDYKTRQILSTEEFLSKLRSSTVRCRTEHCLSLKTEGRRGREREERWREITGKVEEIKTQLTSLLVQKEALKNNWEGEKSKAISDFNSLHRQAAKYLVHLSEKMESPIPLPPAPPL